MKQKDVDIIHRFQNKVLWNIFDAPWYIRNVDLHGDLQMEMVFLNFILQITIYSIRVISKVEVRKGREAGTIHLWFTGVVLLS